MAPGPDSDFIPGAKQPVWAARWALARRALRDAAHPDWQAPTAAAAAAAACLSDSDSDGSESGMMCGQPAERPLSSVEGAILPALTPGQNL